jgi:ACS family hexuronate transporter-like MFS transporter
VSARAGKAFEPVFSRIALIVLVALLLGETTINYIDRQVVSVLAYAVSYTFAGWALDQLGVGRGLTLSIFWWSIADMLTAFAPGPLSLGFFRAILGIGEAGSWPAFAKATAKWVPMEARTLAIGICNSGSSVGAVIAPPLVVWITLRFGWRSCFVVTGGLGPLWVVAFQTFRYLHPEMARSEAVDELAPEPIPWIALLRCRQAFRFMNPGPSSCAVSSPTRSGISSSSGFRNSSPASAA